MSDQRTLREIAQYQWTKVTPPEFMAVMLKLSVADCRIVDKFVADFAAEFGRLAIEATLDVECKRNQTVIFKKAYMSGLVGDVATRMAELLKAEARRDDL